MILSSYLTSMLGSLLVIGFLNSPTPSTTSVKASEFTSLKPMAAHAAVLGDGQQEQITKETCAECHEDEVASFDRTVHNVAWHSEQLGSVECINCHKGDPAAHVTGGDKKGTMMNFTEVSAKEASDICLNCHQTTGEQAHAKIGEHMKAGVSCVQCHNVHPTEKQAMAAQTGGHGAMIPSTDQCFACHSNIATEFAMPSRHRLHEGAMNCSSCHNVHGTTNARQVRNEGKDQCLTCHKDKRGPFMFEHEAAAEEGCIACHAPHGAPGQHMLKMRDPRALCLSCHSKDMGKGVPHGRGSATTMGACTRCHGAIHGSNVDAYLLH